jgi:hypothetical protein
MAPVTVDAMHPSYEAAPRRRRIRRGLPGLVGAAFVLLSASALAVVPEAGKSFKGKTGDYLNNAPRWTREAAGKVSFKVSADGQRLLNFRGTYYYYCGAGTGTVTDKALKIKRNGRFYATGTRVEHSSSGKFTGRNYYLLSGRFVNRGRAVQVSYMDDFVYAGKSVHQPYSTTFHRSSAACESWVHGTVPVAG